MIEVLTKYKPRTNQISGSFQIGWTPDCTPLGNVGHAQIAWADKGETLFPVFAAGVVTFLERIIAWDSKECDT